MNDFVYIGEQLKNIQNQIPASVQLIAVSKTHGVDKIAQAYQSGHRHFGENKVQELLEKKDQLPGDIHWHLIGHLQRNKVKYIIPFVHLIHGVDSLRLLEEINKEAEKQGKIISVLLQVYIAKEESKFGMEEGEIIAFFKTQQWQRYPHVHIKGLMGMATNTENHLLIRQEFSGLKKLFDQCQEWHPLSVLSMGMSADYSIAIECGSSMIRVGSSIFGQRNYHTS